MIVTPFQNERVFYCPKARISAKAFTAGRLGIFGFTGTDFGIMASVIHKFYNNGNLNENDPAYRHVRAAFMPGFYLPGK